MSLPQPVPLDFPLRGLDLSTEAGLQRPLTTPLGTNARSQDPFARRVRGGSRTGLTRYVDARVNGSNPVQGLGVVVTQHADYHLLSYDQTSGPGVRIADPSTSNYPDGPGGTGPGGDGHGGPAWPGGGNRRVPSGGRTVRDGGSGVMMVRSVGTGTSPPSPSPPPPPSTLTRTYTPFASVHDTEHVGVFKVGPFTVPLTPPTDLDPSAVDFFGNMFTIDLSAWGGTSVPTLAQINALFVAGGWADGGTPGGPYETSVDS